MHYANPCLHSFGAAGDDAKAPAVTMAPLRELLCRLWAERDACQPSALWRVSAHPSLRSPPASRAAAACHSLAHEGQRRPARCLCKAVASALCLCVFASYNCTVTTLAPPPPSTSRLRALAWVSVRFRDRPPTVGPYRSRTRLGQKPPTRHWRDGIGLSRQGILQLRWHL